MPKRQRELPPLSLADGSIPGAWLISDLRNDAVLDRALGRLPRGAGVVFRHRHLDPPQRRARFARVRRLARRRGLWVVLAGTMAQARRWGADGAYGAPPLLARGPAGLRLVTAHSLRELAAARRARANAVLLSPVFATRSHPGGRVLGSLRFRLLAARSSAPVIALGGMDAGRARSLAPWRWAAIDGLSRASRPALPRSARALSRPARTLS